MQLILNELLKDWEVEATVSGFVQGLCTRGTYAMYCHNILIFVPLNPLVAISLLPLSLDMHMTIAQLEPFLKSGVLK